MFLLKMTKYHGKRLRKLCCAVRGVLGSDGLAASPGSPVSYMSVAHFRSTGCNFTPGPKQMMTPGDVSVTHQQRGDGRSKTAQPVILVSNIPKHTTPQELLHFFYEKTCTGSIDEKEDMLWLKVSREGKRTGQVFIRLNSEIQLKMAVAKHEKLFHPRRGITGWMSKVHVHECRPSLFEYYQQKTGFIEDELVNTKDYLRVIQWNREDDGWLSAESVTEGGVLVIKLKQETERNVVGELSLEGMAEASGTEITVLRGSTWSFISLYGSDAQINDCLSMIEAAIGSITADMCLDNIMKCHHTEARSVTLQLDSSSMANVTGPCNSRIKAVQVISGVTVKILRESGTMRLEGTVDQLIKARSLVEQLAGNPVQILPVNESLRWRECESRYGHNIQMKGLPPGCRMSQVLKICHPKFPLNIRIERTNDDECVAFVDFSNHNDALAVMKQNRSFSEENRVEMVLRSDPIGEITQEMQKKSCLVVFVKWSITREDIYDFFYPIIPTDVLFYPRNISVDHRAMFVTFSNQDDLAAGTSKLTRELLKGDRVYIGRYRRFQPTRMT